MNPVAGGDDTAHQYFGEAYLAREVRLAPGAVVLLHHLCYASGNSEPGLPEGSLEVAKQRVDNYAAGWLAAGAGAVIADTFGQPGPYLRGLLGTDEAVDRIWREAPTFHGHVLTFPSVRSPGAVAAMDPTGSDSGFNRSIVSWPGLDAAGVRSGAGRVATLPIGDRTTESPVRSLATLGVTFRAPGLVAAGATPTGLVAGTRANLILPVKTPTGVSMPDQLALGVRWDPLEIDTTGPAVSGAAGGDPSPSPSSTPSPSPSPRSRPDPGALPSGTPDPAIQPPGIDPIAPEVLGSVVTPVHALLYHGRLLVTLELPDAAGTYRLVTTVHGADGVAFDGATQALVPAIVVRVSPALSVAFGVVPVLTVEAGARIALPVRVANDGALAWADRPDSVSSSMDALDPRLTRAHPSARLVARWVPLETSGPETPGRLEASTSLAVDPGSQLTVQLALVAPAVPGPYLLLLDVDSPLHGSLAAAGAAPGQVRVTVVPAATPAVP